MERLISYHEWLRRNKIVEDIEYEDCDMCEVDGDLSCPFCGGLGRTEINHTRDVYDKLKKADEKRWAEYSVFINHKHVVS